MLPLPWPILTPDTHQKGFFSQLHLGGNMMPSLLPTLIMNHPCVMAIHSRPFCAKPSPRYHVAFASPQTMAIVVGAGQTKQAEQKNRHVQRPLLWMLHWIRKFGGVMRNYAAWVSYSSLQRFCTVDPKTFRMESSWIGFFDEQCRFGNHEAVPKNIQYTLSFSPLLK